MKKNINLMERTLGVIEANPERHRQDEWRCETGMCFAGHAATLNGVEWSNLEDAHSPWVEVNPSEWNGVTRIHVADYAAKVLGLNGREEDAMFASSNTIDDLKTMVKNLANGNDIMEGLDERPRSVVDTALPF